MVQWKIATLWLPAARAPFRAVAQAQQPAPPSGSSRTGVCALSPPACQRHALLCILKGLAGRLHTPQESGGDTHPSPCTPHSDSAALFLD